jgi:hypothetical protein
MLYLGLLQAQVRAGWCISYGVSTVLHVVWCEDTAALATTSGLVYCGETMLYLRLLQAQVGAGCACFAGNGGSCGNNFWSVV